MCKSSVLHINVQKYMRGIIMINYGEALRTQRVIAKLSTVELAKQIGTSHQNICRWESGKVLPNIDFCVKLADFYGITVDELIGRQII